MQFRSTGSYLSCIRAANVSKAGLRGGSCVNLSLRSSASSTRLPWRHAVLDAVTKRPASAEGRAILVVPSGSDVGQKAHECRPVCVYTRCASDALPIRRALRVPADPANNYLSRHFVIVEIDPHTSVRRG